MNRLTFPHLEYMNSCEKISPAYQICYLFSVMTWQTPVSWKDLGYYFWFIIFWQRKQKYNFHRYFPLKSSSIPFPRSNISSFNYWKFVLLEFHWGTQTVSIKSTPKSLPATSPRALLLLPSDITVFVFVLCHCAQLAVQIYTAHTVAAPGIMETHWYCNPKEHRSAPAILTYSYSARREALWVAPHPW